MSLPATLRSVAFALAASTSAYVLFLAALTVPWVQNQVVYLNRVTLTWSQDVSVPEQWGFLRGQVAPFNLPTPDGEVLRAWHILPLGLYVDHEADLVREHQERATDSGWLDPEAASNGMAFRLLRDDPDALLVLYLHGAAGTLGSGWRPHSYRAMSAAAPRRIHTVAIDYRGFGTSTGSPSEPGLLADALALSNWATQAVGIDPSRIVLYSQSLGTAVAVALAEHLVKTTAANEEPTLFAGMVLTAPFADVARLSATYRLGCVVPLLEPVAGFPAVMRFLNSFSRSKWPTTQTITSFVKWCEAQAAAEKEAIPKLKYDITIIHAEDDYDIPYSHSDLVYWHAVNASTPDGITREALEAGPKAASRARAGEAGWVAEHRTRAGVVREHVVRYGLHDRVMSYPVVSAAVMRAFGSGVGKP